MPCWFYDKKALMATPSIQDGIDQKTECQYRKEGAQLIIQIGSQMELGYNTLATGIVYFHRFYMFHSFRTFSPYITACCCLFLAGKAEETPKKSKDIIKIAKTFLSEDKLPLLGQDPREEVMTMEKILLQTMKFDLKIRHPYYFLLKYAKCLKGDKRRKQKMVQMAWTFINDSLCTTLSIQWEPEVIAIAVMHLAGKLVRFKISGWSRRKPSHTHWWEIFVEDLSLKSVEDICHQVLDLYSPASRYIVIKLYKPVQAEPESSVNNQIDSPAVNIDMKVAVRDPRLENGTISVIANPTISLKDPRLESGSIFVKSRVEVNNSNTPVLAETVVIKQSPSTPTAPYFMDQSFQNNSHIYANLNTSLKAENELQENSRLPYHMSNYNTPTMSSPMNPLTNVGQPMLKKGFNNVNDLQTMESRGFGFGNNNNKDYNDNQMNRRRGFGCMHNNNRDYDDNRPMRSRGFRNHGRNNHSGFGRNRCRRRSFEDNNHSDVDDRAENRSMGARGFGNANNWRNNNRRYDENKPQGNRGFGNANENNDKYDENKPLGNRGFGNANDNNRFDENKPLGNRGFGNANDNNNRFDENKPLGTRGFGNANDNNNRFDENKPLGTRGFGNANDNNNRFDENKPLGTRGFGNANDNNNRFDENKPLGTRGFGNSNYNNNRNFNENRPMGNRSFRNNNDNNGRYNENKPLMSRGFGNSDNCNDNDSRPRMRFNRGNRFQRSDPYPRRFNNNYENDRYSHNNGNHDNSNDSMRDAPGKIVDKQSFYHPSPNSNNEKAKDEEEEEEESWD